VVCTGINSCVDGLANISCDSGFTLIYYEHVPAQVFRFLATNYVRVSTP
jgi:hypothetical protein